MSVLVDRYFMFGVSAFKKIMIFAKKTVDNADNLILIQRSHIENRHPTVSGCGFLDRTS